MDRQAYTLESSFLPAEMRAGVKEVLDGSGWGKKGSFRPRSGCRRVTVDNAQSWCAAVSEPKSRPINQSPRYLSNGEVSGERTTHRRQLINGKSRVGRASSIESRLLMSWGGGWANLGTGFKNPGNQRVEPFSRRYQTFVRSRANGYRAKRTKKRG